MIEPLQGSELLEAVTLFPVSDQVSGPPPSSSAWKASAL
jgi:hypothetical protein